MYKKIFLVFLSLFCFRNTFCQKNSDYHKFKVFATISPVSSTIKNEYKYLGWAAVSNKEKSKQGFSSMFGIEFQLNNYFSIQTGIQYSLRSYSSVILYEDTIASNWKSIPRRYDSETKYQFLSFPINLKYFYFQTTKFKPYIRCGFLINMIRNYENNVRQTFYNGSLKDFDLSIDRKMFKTFNYSIAGSLGFEYDLFQKFYFNTELYYDYMFDYFSGDKTYYKFAINDLGLNFSIGVKL